MTVVVGYVPTETGFSAVREAEREARSHTADVVIVNVVGPAGYVAPTAADEVNLDAVVAHLTAHGIPNSLKQVVDGAGPAHVILEVAREVEASLIVLGLHQRSWLAKRVLGSTARSVVLAAPCSVLVVPDIDPRPKHQPVDAPPLPSMGQTQPPAHGMGEHGSP